MTDDSKHFLQSPTPPPVSPPAPEGRYVCYTLPMNLLYRLEQWLPIALIAAAIAALLALLFGAGSRAQGRPTRARRRLPGTVALAAVTGFYVVMLLAAVFFPLPLFDGRVADAATLRASVVLRPLDSLIHSWHIARVYWAQGKAGPMRLFLINQLGNLALLMPAAVLLWILFSRRGPKPRRGAKSKGRLAGLGRRLGRVLLICTAISLGIELSQLLLNYISGSIWRIVDVNDVLLNVGGAGIAALGCWLVNAVLRLRGRRRGALRT